jgi:predicted GNAT family N-acyltransferase
MALQQITSLTDEQITELQQLYQHEWWTEGRTEDDVRKMIENTDELVAFSESDAGELVAFARVLTDYVSQALVQDVIVSEQYRGRGVGEHLVKAIVTHPDLKSVDLVDLYCTPELREFYASLGFTDELVNDLRLMRYEGEIEPADS